MKITTKGVMTSKRSISNTRKLSFYSFHQEDNDKKFEVNAIKALVHNVLNTT